MKLSRLTVVYAALLTVALIYGATYIVAKDVMPVYLKPSGFIMIRIWIGALLLTILHITSVKESIRERKDWLRLIVCAFFGVFFNMLMYFKGLSITSPINASLIMTITPVLVLIFAVLLKEEKVTWRKGIGVLLGMTGAALLIATTQDSVKSASWQGDLIITLNASSYAIYLVLAKPLMNKYNPFTIIRWTFTFGSLMILPFGFPDLLRTDFGSFPAFIWGEIAFVVFGTTFLAYLLNAWALKRVKPSVVGAFIYLQPLIATTIAIGTGKYELFATQIIFAAFILLGVYLVSTGKSQKIKS